MSDSRASLAEAEAEADLRQEEAACAGTYDVIFATDLVYQPDCWKLCGDAHCCHFDRYQRYGPPNERGLTKIPMLAGEYVYMRDHGLLGQYRAHEHESKVVAIGDTSFPFELLVVRSEGRCPCEHDRRPTVCRLYPLMPLFDASGRLEGVDSNFSVFEEFESLAHIPRACRVCEMPLAQVQLFVRLCSAIGRNPHVLFSLMALETLKRLFRDQLACVMREQGIPAYAALPLMEHGGEYIERPALAAALETMLRRFREVHGAGFEPLAGRM